jgi:hypothetical protein
MTNKILIIVCLLIVVVAVGWFYNQRNKQADDGLLSHERAATLEIAEISMEGSVISVGEDHLVVSAGRIERTERGNMLVNYDRVVRLSGMVQFAKGDERIEMSAAQVLQNLKVRDRVVFYGSGSANPIGSEEFTASRVDILNRAAF